MFTTRPEIRGTFGVVASTHWIASGVGMAMLERGGNAFDAAVAIGFVLQIVEPHLCGPAGEVPIIFKASREDAPTVLCGQGVAPAAATIERMREMNLDMVPGSGLIAAVVPGSFDAWMTLLREWIVKPFIGSITFGIAYVWILFDDKNQALYDKVMSNLEEVKARGGPVIAVACEGDDEVAARADEVIYVPEVPEYLQPLVSVVPLQLLAYHIALLRDCDVDKPRNLAKSVTVE